ncbi:acyl-CoA dehydrogenase family protein, partial [Acinetobacter pragensis]
MDFNLTEEQNAFADSVRKFAQKELADGALERAHSHEYPWEIAAKLSEMG